MGLVTFTRVAVLTLLGLTTACAHTPDVETNDLVVLGRVERIAYEPLDELSTDGLFTARLTLTRVIRGRPPSSVMTIRYVAHTDLVSDRDFRFRLHRSAGGDWLVCAKPGERGFACP